MEIDVAATLRDKRGVEMESYVILGACRPDLAHQALQVDRSIGGAVALQRGHRCRRRWFTGADSRPTDHVQRYRNCRPATGNR
ncbi:DUF302 domain-containing protein [Segeticoccus rhizosphaerae]|uniref:DUF302 domain-containing protein n=1 Tax=Segeticoccus rhizosphaerae TaxID=1104777 RepID=UPI00192E35C6